MLKDLIAVLRGELSSAILHEKIEAHKFYANIAYEVKLDLIAERKLRNELLRPMSLAMGRLVAKLDPSYNVDEMDRARRKASDAIGESVMNRLRVEAAAQRKMMGES